MGQDGCLSLKSPDESFSQVLAGLRPHSHIHRYLALITRCNVLFIYVCTFQYIADDPIDHFARCI